MKISGSTTLLVVVLCLFCVAPATAQGIGVASAVKNEVTATLGGSTAPLNVGNPLFQNQIVATGGQSAAQLIFLDETSLSIGPNSEVTLDTFVYDPGRRTGKIVLQTGKGVFRFITGSSAPTSYSLKTAAATIGFRGSIVDIIYTGNLLTFICVEATIEIVLPDGTIIVLDTPGQAVTVDEFGVVEGPYTWSGEYYDVVDGFSFPLYGNGFVGGPQEIVLPDGRIHVLDEIKSGDSPPLPKID